MRTAAVALLRLRTPADVLAAVPYLLGFHPTDSLVVLGLRAARLVFSVRGDLPPPGTPPGRDVGYLAQVFAQQEVDTVLLVGYGPPSLVTPFVLAAQDRFRARGIEVSEILRATDGRYWSYVCESPECCPPDGTAYDVAGSRIAAEATFAGQVALPDRNALVRRLGPPEGPALAAMERATERAEERLVAVLDAASDAPAAAAGFVAAGAAAVAGAVQRHAAGGYLTDDEVAELSLLLASTEVRDTAWEPISPGSVLADAGPGVSTVDLHIRLWTDVVSRACPDLVAPAAGLLSYAAWLAGDGTTAAFALDRALAADPGYSMARLMAEVLHRAIPPTADGSMRRRRRRRARRR
jgi:hypothetical protein